MGEWPHSMEREDILVISPASTNDNTSMVVTLTRSMILHLLPVDI